MVIALVWLADAIFQLSAGVGITQMAASTSKVIVGSILGVISIGFVVRNPVFMARYQMLCFVVLCTGVWTAVEGTRTVATVGSIGYLLCFAGALRALLGGVMSHAIGRTYPGLAR